jgi:hypothetical protein
MTMTLTGSQMEQLRDAMCAAFDQASLKQMVRFRLAKDLQHLVNASRPMHELVFDLIDAADRQGWTDQLVTAAHQFVPGNDQLQAYCALHAPYALAATNPAGVMDAVREGYWELAQLAANQTIRDSAVAFQARFQGERRLIEKLSHYKSLHDGLHTLQIKHVQQITRQEEKFPSPRSLTALEDYEADLREIADQIRPVVEQVPTALDERTWFHRFERSIDLLRQAREGPSPDRLSEAIDLLTRVVSVQPSRIYSLLTFSFSELHLQEMVTDLQRICDEADRLTLDGNPVARFRAGLKNMDGLQRGVKELIGEHGEWQQIDNELRELNASPERIADNLPLLWPEQKERLIRLCNRSGEAWANELRKKTTELDEAINAWRAVAKQREADAATKALRQVVDILWFTWRKAGTRFFFVDRQLDRLCTQLREIGNLLEAVLDTIRQSRRDAGGGGR